ncbi:MAG: hypothetical protein M1598_01240 [Actinobacteria bacterium]|nr:hypothetical protein [Actinomycetota bacterium]
MPNVKGTMNDKSGTISAVWYTGISLGLALLFILATGNPEKYNAVARYGGAAWVFVLSMIITMPLATSYFKGGGGVAGHH